MAKTALPSWLLSEDEVFSWLKADVLFTSYLILPVPLVDLEEIQRAIR